VQRSLLTYLFLFRFENSPVDDLLFVPLLGHHVGKDRINRRAVLRFGHRRMFVASRLRKGGGLGRRHDRDVFLTGCL